MAKSASLILSIAIWFLISDHLKSRASRGISDEDETPIGLGPAVNPALQGPGETVEPEPEKPTVH